MSDTVIPCACARPGGGTHAVAVDPDIKHALRSVGRELMRNHLKHCAAEAIRSDDPERSAAMYEELLELVFRSTK